jgi:hypothetical protein
MVSIAVVTAPRGGGQAETVSETEPESGLITTGASCSRPLRTWFLR